MTLNREVAVRRMREAALLFCLPAMGLMLFAGASASAQSTEPGAGEARTYATIYVPPSMDQRNFLEVQSDLRNLLGRAKIYGVMSQNAISIYGTPEEIALARKVVADMTRPKKSYQLTYIISGMDGGTRRENLTVVSGGTAQTKQGERVPVVTGVADAAGSTNTQVQYLDVGVNIKAQLVGTGDDLELHSSIELSGMAEQRPTAGAQDPVIRQATLDVTSNLLPGKQTVLGSLDIPGGSPGSTHHLEIAVSAAPVQ